MPKIFDPFVTTKERGSGLGLSICRVIADAHRASIYATNTASGRGAVVVVEFPVLTRESIATSNNGIDLGQMSPRVDTPTLSL